MYLHVKCGCKTKNIPLLLDGTLNPKLDFLRLALLSPDKWYGGMDANTDMVPKENYTTIIETVPGDPSCPYLNFNRISPINECLVMSDSGGDAKGGDAKRNAFSEDITERGGEIIVFYQRNYVYCIDYEITSNSSTDIEVMFLNPDYDREFAYQTYDSKGRLVKPITIPSKQTVRGEFIRDAHNSYMIVKTTNRDLHMRITITALEDENSYLYKKGDICLFIKGCNSVPVYTNSYNELTGEYIRILYPEFKLVSDILNNEYYSNGYPPCLDIPALLPPPSPSCTSKMYSKNIDNNSTVTIVYSSTVFSPIYIDNVTPEIYPRYFSISYAYYRFLERWRVFGLDIGKYRITISDAVLICKNCNGCSINLKDLPLFRLLKYKSTFKFDEVVSAGHISCSQASGDTIIKYSSVEVEVGSGYYLLDFTQNIQLDYRPFATITIIPVL